MRYKHELPGAGSHLERYAACLSAVEINSSFHRHHRAQTYERWSKTVPSDFRFAVKTPRVFTHEGELVARAEVLKRFADEVAGLGAKLGVVLVQLPPTLAFNAATARRFFKAMYRRIDARYVCEPRHPSWGSASADRLLTELHIARVAADPPPWPGADEPGGWPGLAYFRWHGQPRKYYSNYEEHCLARLQEQMSAAAAPEVWAIFDNTAHGHALGNALSVSRAIPTKAGVRKRSRVRSQ